MAVTRRKAAEIRKSETDSPFKELTYLYRFKKLVLPHPTSYFDNPQFLNSDSYGFFVCFWVVHSLFTTGVLLSNYIQKGYLLSGNVFQLMQKDLLKIGLLDLVMYLCMYVTFGLQILVKHRVVNWWSYGWILQHIWQFVYFFTFLAAPRYFQFPWIGSVFIVLHMIVQIMKQHSYAVCNGWLGHISHDVKRIESSTGINPRENVNNEDPILTVLKVKYPDNLTLSNFFWYTMYPTCVYEVDYPRTDRIRWGYLFRKVIEVFAIIWIILVYSEQYMYPLATKAIGLRNEPVIDRLWLYPLLIFDLFGPFVNIYMLVFYLIWESILNAIAELTRYGDRQFYRDWWNSQTWDKFARDWNMPVHHFLSRHVYHSTIFWLKLSKPAAATCTFVLSAMMHELVMYVIFGRLRGYLLLAQLSQLPLEALTLVPAIKRRKTIGVTLFWIGMAIGPSVLCSLYLIF